MKGDWTIARLGSLTEISYGFTESASWDRVGPKFLRITDIQPDGVNWDAVPYCTVSGSDLDKFRLAHDDIVFARTGATTGKSHLVQHPPESVFASYLIRMRLQSQALLPQFLHLFFQTAEYWKAIEAGSTGSAQGGFNASKLGALQIKFPAVGEQERIVAILDEAFEGIAIAKANAEKNLQNAREVFEGHLQEVFDRNDDGWRKTTLSEATGGVFTGPFGSLLHKSDYIEDGIPLVNPAHISDVGIEPDYRKSVSEATAQRLSNYVLRAGDIVIARRGEMGRCAVITEAENGWLCGTGSFVIRSGNQCDARFLVRLLRSQSCRKRLEAIAGGAVMPNLSNTDLGNFEILLPPLGVQRSVLEAVEALAGEVQRLEGVYQRKLSALDELKKSLLHQAFSGRL